VSAMEGRGDGCSARTHTHGDCAVGDAPVSYCRWRVVSGPTVDPSLADDTYMVLVERLLTLKERRHVGLGASVLACALSDIYTLIKAGPATKVARISLFVPVCEDCLHAASTAAKVGFQLHGPVRAEDPTTFVDAPEFLSKIHGVQEFTIDVPGFIAAMEDMERRGAAGGAA